MWTRSYIWFLPLLLLTSTASLAVPIVEDFEAAGFINHADLGDATIIGDFRYSVDSGASLKSVVPPAALYPGYDPLRPTSTFVISHVAGSEFRFMGFEATDQFAMTPASVVVRGYRNGIHVTLDEAVNIPWPSAVIDFSSKFGFTNVDEVRISAADLFFLFESWTADVAIGNRPGSITINNVTPVQNQTLTATVSDLDGISGAVTYQWKRGAVVVGNAQSYITVQADVDQTLTVSASYIDDLYSTESIVSAATSTVINVNDAPVITSTAGISATEATPYIYTAAVTDVDDANDGTNLAWSLTNAPAGMLVSTTGEVSWTPANGITTSGVVTLTVADGGENGAVAATEIFTLSVTAVNTAPVITSTAGTTATEGSLYSYTATVTDADDVNDGTKLTWSVTNAPTGMTVSNTGVVSWTPSNGVTTSGVVTLTVADGGEDGAVAATEIFTLSVTAVNTAPNITSTAGTTATEATPYSYTATVTDVDDANDGTNLAWSLTNQPAGMTVSNTGVVSWTPANGVTTSGAVTLAVADGGEDGAIAATEIFTIAVANVNSAGIATITGTANEGQLLSADISDADGISSSIFSYQWKRAGSHIRGATASIYTLALADVGSAITVTIGYSDDQSTVESITSAATGNVLSDIDGDGIADITDPDDDNDTVLDGEDAFPFDATESADTDLDGVGDNADAFPNDASESLDTDADNVGNNTDVDDDNDGLPDMFEIVLGLDPLDASDADYDLDADMYSNLIEYVYGSRLDDITSVPSIALFGPDTDGDGIPDIDDAFPNDPAEFIDTDGDGIGNRADSDDDDDGVSDNFDEMPLNDSEIDDSDGDNVGDNTDALPNDATESKDTDGDGVGDNSDTDADGDGVDNSLDAFPLNATETVDTDADGVGDNADAFPNDPAESLDTDLDGTGNNTDTDDDNDGVADISDNCPLVSNPAQADVDNNGIGDLCDGVDNSVAVTSPGGGGGSFDPGLLLLLGAPLAYFRYRQQRVKQSV